MRKVVLLFFSMSESNFKNNTQFNFKNQYIIWNDRKVTIRI